MFNFLQNTVLFKRDADYQTPYLTAVTLEVEVFIEGHHSDRFLTAGVGNDGFITAHTQRRETSARKRRTGCWLFLVNSQ